MLDYQVLLFRLENYLQKYLHDPKNSRNFASANKKYSGILSRLRGAKKGIEKAVTRCPYYVGLYLLSLKYCTRQRAQNLALS